MQKRKFEEKVDKIKRAAARVNNHDLVIGLKPLTKEKLIAQYRRQIDEQVEFFSDIAIHPSIKSKDETYSFSKTADQL